MEAAMVNLRLILLLALSLRSLCNAALVYVTPSKEDQQAVCDSIWRFHQHDPPFSNNLRWDDLRVATACRKYFVEPQDAAAGRLLSATKSGGWRFVFFSRTNAIGGTDCSADPTSGKPMACGEFGTNDYPTETIAMAEQLPETRKQDYEVRLFAASFFCGLWLHAKSNDIFIPANACFGKLQAFKPYSEAQLIKILQPYERTMMLTHRDGYRERQSHDDSTSTTRAKIRPRQLVEVAIIDPSVAPRTKDTLQRAGIESEFNGTDLYGVWTAPAHKQRAISLLNGDPFIKRSMPFVFP
jgi:hypothetical protein